MHLFPVGEYNVALQCGLGQQWSPRRFFSFSVSVSRAALVIARCFFGGVLGARRRSDQLAFLLIDDALLSACVSRST